MLNANMETQEQHRLQDKKITLTQANKIPKKLTKSCQKANQTNRICLNCDEITRQFDPKRKHGSRRYRNYQRVELNFDRISVACSAGVRFQGVFFLSQESDSFQLITFIV